jgi:hypothetical protein
LAKEDRPLDRTLLAELTNKRKATALQTGRSYGADKCHVVGLCRFLSKSGFGNVESTCDSAAVDSTGL